VARELRSIVRANVLRDTPRAEQLGQALAA
jgi:hypothetical protein